MNASGQACIALEPPNPGMSVQHQTQRKGLDISFRNRWFKWVVELSHPAHQQPGFVVRVIFRHLPPEARRAEATVSAAGSSEICPYRSPGLLGRVASPRRPCPPHGSPEVCP